MVRVRKRKDRDAFAAEEGEEVTSESEDAESEEVSLGGSSTDEDEGVESGGGKGSRRETPEQKRLRLAKAYLKSMEIQKEAEQGGEEDGVEEWDGEGPAPVDISERLKVEALAQRGHYQRHIADKVVPSGEGCRRLICRPMSRSGGGAFHRKSLTGVCVPSADDTKCYSVSKCGALVGWDLTELRRNNAFTARVRDCQRADSSGGTSTATSGESLYSVCCSDDGRLVVTGGHSGAITVWDSRSGDRVKVFDKGHKSEVTGLTFQTGTMQLFSCSRDRTVKIWSLDDMAYVDTLFGHVQGCMQLDCLRKERVISVGEDRTCRLWKVQDETQLLFKGTPNSGNIDSCCFVNGTTFVTGSQDNSLSLWSMFKKRPNYTLHGAHEAAAMGNPCKSWIHSLAACPNTDLVASGSGDGHINLYKVNPEEQVAGDRVQRVCTIPRVEGYVNSLAFNGDATVLVAGVGQEPRMGRWDRNKNSRNGLFVQRLKVDGGDDA
ncbi:U3 small nucleolar RNA-interacting protein [Chloropicon primus]|uniref:U3 small nucleolar RNA-interacting protein n=1 Tax=Chloropicon primus TaxID=1764295 RepID=A0A5B8MRU5_9CHLO|nr:U3 small nucleolar RNA-interacting protein [Chloropicon primus]UPR01592.1 U3 small nucleolar RNA-interacting protein [Chloropicon primus]|mmetsp:Transcript_3379/g.9446  ORF Transcript_3379/g.9446 Transcript_3379/m.9446 type:complete len:491 (+) Transcript_3379:394-1866(+)|eukprot:QDZ22375.1 U3 small nucleolar RNA-interacting protein [Chloropicon primus]